MPSICYSTKYVAYDTSKIAVVTFHLFMELSVFQYGMLRWTSCDVTVTKSNDVIVTIYQIQCIVWQTLLLWRINFYIELIVNYVENGK